MPRVLKALYEISMTSNCPFKLTSERASRRDNMKKITKKEIRDYATKYFDEWLNNCPCEHIIIKPSMNTKDNTIVIEFDFMRAVEVD